MLVELTSETLSKVQNPAFAAYAAMYEDIYASFLGQVGQAGLDFEQDGYRAEKTALLERLRQKKANFRNGGKSIYTTRLSSACEDCRTGVGSATFFVSLKCHRSCYYCFNPNQENYDHFSQNTRDATGELRQAARQKVKARQLALTGGEPLLFKPETIAFFQTAQELFPKAYKRLYTCGDLVDEAVLQQLKEAGLDEIRFSIRMHDLEKGRRGIFERIALARSFIPQVMVEMPVLPGTLEIMKVVLLELDRLGVFAINLLEFCFPFHNAEEFRRRGFQLKERPYQVLYNYYYAGGLPVAGSEQVCLELLEFALDQGLQLGVHYCSLENKHTGQVYQQNRSQMLPKQAVFSQRDFFIKTAKVFGEDILPALRVFQKVNYRDYNLNETYKYLEFHVSKVKALASFDPEIGISYSVWENRGSNTVLRELKVDYTTARMFDLHKDI